MLNEICLLRLWALLAHTRGDEVDYREFRNRYRAKATECGLEGHTVSAEAQMPSSPGMCDVRRAGA